MLKMAKRFLTLLLLALMCISFVVACTPDTHNDTSGTGGEASGGSDWVMPERPVEEMSGKEFIIIQHEEEISPFGYLENSANAEKVLKRMSEVENLYDCTLRFSTIAYGNDFVTALQALAYETNAGDLVFSTNQAYLRKALGTGGSAAILQPILRYDEIINFWNEEKWGGKTAKECMMAGGEFYGVTPALWINYLPTPYYNYVYNKDLVAAAGQGDPQELLEQGQWTRDKMWDLIAACSDSTGTDVIYGLVASRNHLIRATFMSSGCQTVVINSVAEDGTVDWTLGWDSPEAEDALDFLITQLRNHAQEIKLLDGGSWDSWKDLIDGTAATILTRPSALINNIATNEEVDIDFHYSLAPWAGPDSGYVAGYFENVCAVGIPSFAQNGRWSAFLMADLFEPLDGFSSRQDVIDYYRTNYFESDLDLQLFLGLNFNDLSYSYWSLNCSAMYTKFAEAISTAPSAASLISQYAHTADSDIETYIVPNQAALAEYAVQGYFD